MITPSDLGRAAAARRRQYIQRIELVVLRRLRPPDVHALKRRCIRKSAKGGAQLPSGGKFKHSSSILPNLCALWTQLVSDTFAVAHKRSFVIITAHCIMFQMLTGMRSSHAHRMWSDLNISSDERGRALLDAASHRPRAPPAV